MAKFFPSPTANCSACSSCAATVRRSSRTASRRSIAASLTVPLLVIAMAHGAIPVAVQHYDVSDVATPCIAGNRKPGTDVIVLSKALDDKYLMGRQTRIYREHVKAVFGA